jgi:hypothetical protein
MVAAGQSSVCVGVMLRAAVHFSNACCLAVRYDYAPPAAGIQVISAPRYTASVSYPVGGCLFEELAVLCKPQHVKQQILSR